MNQPDDPRPIASPRAALTRAILESHPEAPVPNPPEEGKLFRKYRTAGGAYHDREVKGEEWTHSATIKLARHILAQRGVLPPLVRIWKRDGLIQIGMQKGDKKVTLGMGASYQQAFENIFIAPIRAKEEMNAEIEREEKSLREESSAAAPLDTRT